MNMLKDKRGNWMDIPEYIKLALYLAIVFFIGLAVYTNFNTQIQGHADIPSETKTISTNFLSAYILFDYLFLFLSLILWMISIVMARVIPSSSNFAILGVFMILFMPLMAMLIVNFWASFITSPVISALLTQVTWIPLILNNLVLVTFIYSVSVGIALYTKKT